MKKSLIALALAGALASPAFAASGNVDIYGVMDASVNMVSADIAGVDQDAPFIASTGSHVGFRGAEDLGSGMTAVWQIESGFSVDEPSGALAGRNTFLGLTGNFGSVLVGTHDTPVQMLGRSVDNFTDTMADSRNILGAVSTGDNLYDLRASNTVMYTAPVFSGLSLSAAYSADLAGTVPALDDNATDALSVSGTYKNGPLMLGAGFERHNATAFEADITRIVAGYEFAGAKLAATYEKTDGDALADNREAYGVFGSYPVGALTLKASFLRAGKSDAGLSDGAEQWAIGADYALSKRTAVYGFYAAVDNDADAAFGFGAGAESSDQAVGLPGVDPTVLGLGMRHAF